MASNEPSVLLGHDVSMSTHVYRVIVRGRFDELDQSMRSELLADADTHDAMRAAFSREGTLTYDQRLDFFSFRFEVRVNSDDVLDTTEAAFETATEQARIYLERRGLGYRHLKPTGTDLTRIWDAPDE